MHLWTMLRFLTSGNTGNRTKGDRFPIVSPDVAKFWCFSLKYHRVVVQIYSVIRLAVALKSW